MNGIRGRTQRRVLKLCEDREVSIENIVKALDDELPKFVMFSVSRLVVLGYLRNMSPRGKPGRYTMRHAKNETVARRLLAEGNS